MKQSAPFGAAMVLVAAAATTVGPAIAADSEALWLPQGRAVNVSPESLGYPATPGPVEAGAAGAISPSASSLRGQSDPDAIRRTDRRNDSNWRIRPVQELKEYDRSTIPEEDRLNRPTALRIRL